MNPSKKEEKREEKRDEKKEQSILQRRCWQTER